MLTAMRDLDAIERMDFTNFIATINEHVADGRHAALDAWMSGIDVDIMPADRLASLLRATMPARTSLASWGHNHGRIIQALDAIGYEVPEAVRRAA